MIRIDVPATSANLGSGFDCLGVALSLYNEVFMKEWDRCEIHALDGLPIATDQHNLIYKTVKYLYDLCGKPFPGLYLEQKSAVPMARGLGSSSACRFFYLEVIQ